MEYNGKKYELKFKGQTLILFKEQFGEDLLGSIGPEEKKFDTSFILKALWSLLKTADEDFLSFDDFAKEVDVLDILQPSVIQEITKVLTPKTTKVKSNKKK